ncbi:PREDICTED: MDS1 and EVI1 complex locus protein EVI1-A-like [Rhagoletis zephyria]|uniref:MDS1 and EVI1 complex locus protein EVI1-A-like n=1 Tax=Rhagoletis zephyria TaxID=28612 RepID=UPI000811299D|nr:PREDICTED: MDS1 and EVI1 complex locus protein EVI1-A-like [Rhagoletis zephyria]
MDIYPILGSLLGVDTSVTAPGTSARSAPNAASRNEPPVNDLYSYLNNNSSGAAAMLQRESFMQCRHCNRYYPTIQKLQEHVRKYCLKEKKYKCISCEYRSRRKDHVLRHAKRKHCELYEASRDNEESLYEIRNEDEVEDPPRYEDHTGDHDGAIYGGGDGDGDIEADDLDDVCDEMPVNAFLDVGPFNFGLGSRDLTITAVPILQDSEDDDDDNYDDDEED